MTENFLRCMRQVWINEGVINGETGDYTEDGTTTRFGIAYEFNQPELAQFGIYRPDQMNLLTEEIAAEIYWDKYWIKSGAESLPMGVDYLVFDAAVNQGPGYAARMVQECINTFMGEEVLRVDGMIGPKTRSFMMTVGPHAKSMKAIVRLHRQMDYYRRLTNLARKDIGMFDHKGTDFEASWLRRIWHNV